MKIAILGGGFTGLSAALALLKKGHQVTIFEKEDSLGGLAGGFKRPSWDWTLERSYHHWFTNDDAVLNLAKEVGQKVLIIRPKTDIFVKGEISTLDSPLTLLTFPYLPLIDRLRTGLATLYLKLLNNFQSLEKEKALPWIKKWMGEKSLSLIWEPLFTGKFGKYKDEITLTWFWARIKKRTSSLAYPEGGFVQFAQKLAQVIEGGGGKIHLKTQVKRIQNQPKSVLIETSLGKYAFDKVVVTLPFPIFAKITPDLPSQYVKQITSVEHLSALNLVLVLKKPFLKNSYWLNITDQSFPFLVLVEHTNFIEGTHYNNEHLLYIGNYLPPDHPYLKMSAKDLLKIFDPYLKKINSAYQQSLKDYYLFQAPFAQPIVTSSYTQKIKTIVSLDPFTTPLPNVYLANLDMVYPWDRGTNYAVEMGEKAAEVIGKVD